MSVRLFARVSTAAALVGALVFAGSIAGASAAGEADGLYSATNGAGGQFLQLSKVDASSTNIGPESTAYAFFSIEVVNGLGYATGVIFGPDPDVDDDRLAVFTWNISTGAVLTAVPLDATITRVWALDTRGDGALLAYVEVEETDAWVASIDPETGHVTTLVPLSAAGDGRIFEGLATNPVDGITYALADYDDGIPAASAIDFVGGGFGPSILYTAVADTVGAGWFSEGDFDASGVLWFIYSVGSVSRTNAELDVAVEATALGSPNIADKAISVGSGTAPAPALAETGVAGAPVLVIAAALLLVGFALSAGRRRSAAA